MVQLPVSFYEISKLSAGATVCSKFYQPAFVCILAGDDICVKAVPLSEHDNAELFTI